MLTPSNQYLQAVEEINDYVNQAKCRASVSVNSEIRVNYMSDRRLLTKYQILKDDYRLNKRIW